MFYQKMYFLTLEKCGVFLVYSVWSMVVVPVVLNTDCRINMNVLQITDKTSLQIFLFRFVQGLGREIA